MPRHSGKHASSADASIYRWWLESGDEECPHCEAAYAYEAEVLCVDCDSPLCPLCAVWVRRQARCPECAEA